MSVQLIAKRYARALDASVQDGRELEGLVKALEEFAIMLDEHEGLRGALQNPVLPPKVRENVLQEILERLDAPDMARRFLQALFHRDRIGAIDEVVAALQILVDERANRTRAEVLIASKLSQEQRRRVESSLTRYSGKTVQMDTRIDPEILGGAVVRMEGAIIDGSLRSRLRRIREALLAEEDA